MTPVTIRLSAREHAAVVARQRLADALGGRASQPIGAYCHQLVDWVLNGGSARPVGSPTDDTRGMVRTAINAGLKEAYGHENDAHISRDIRVRRDAL